MYLSTIWQRLKAAKVQAMLFLLLVIGLAAHVAIVLVEHRSGSIASTSNPRLLQQHSANSVPEPESQNVSESNSVQIIVREVAKAIADACIVSFLLGITYEWRIRKDSEEQLSNLIDERLQHHNALVSTSISESSSSLSGKIDEVLNNTVQAAAIHSEVEFFDRLEASIITAKHRVDLTYFDNLPPVTARMPRSIAYYQRLAEAIKAGRHVTFRRLIRANEAMWPRLQELIDTESGNSNVSVACLIDRSPEKETSEAVTLQLIDDDIVFLVSLGTQTNASGPRDIIITSKLLSTMWSRYYEQLWRDAIIIVDRGVYKDKEWERVKALTTKKVKTEGSQRSKKTLVT